MGQIRLSAKAGVPKEIAPGVAMLLPATLDAEDLDGYDVTLTLELTLEGVRPTSVTVSSRDGSSVTGTVMRSVRLFDLVRQGIAIGVLWSKRTDKGQQFMVGGLDDALVERLRADGPTDEALEWVARIYELGKVLGLPPARRVELELGLTQPTATRWIRKARERGFLAAAATG